MTQNSKDQDVGRKLEESVESCHVTPHDVDFTIPRVQVEFNGQVF